MLTEYFEYTKTMLSGERDFYHHVSKYLIFPMRDEGVVTTGEV